MEIISSCSLQPGTPRILLYIDNKNTITVGLSVGIKKTHSVSTRSFTGKKTHFLVQEVSLYIYDLPCTIIGGVHWEYFIINSMTHAQRKSPQFRVRPERT